MGKIKLFGDSDEEECSKLNEIKTNVKFAKSYTQSKKRVLSQQLKSLENEFDEDSSADDVTTDEEVIDPEFDQEFFKTMAYLKNKNPEKYKEIPKFWENTKTVEESVQEKKKKKEKTMNLMDYERKVMLEKGGIYVDEDADHSKFAGPTIVEEQEMIKDEIKKALGKIDSDGSGDEDETAGFLTRRKKTKEEQVEEKDDYTKWLADATNEVPDDVKPLKPLKDFWSSKTLSKDDAFLRDYILNKRFVENYELPTYDQIVNSSEDEKELEKQEEYEQKYNFRFEEPDNDFIKRYPRVIEDSVRVEPHKRREKKDKLKERKQHEKELRKKELEELKALKLQEIQEKIARLKEIAGNENFNIEEDELEKEFDPSEHDRQMDQAFNDEYYEIDEDVKPEFPDLDEELEIENWDNYEKIKQGQKSEKYCEDDDFVMDCDYQEAETSKQTLQDELLEGSKKKKKKGRRRGGLAEIIKKEKPVFDPNDEKTYADYIEEYYKLDYEDMIGDVRCRFKYVETVPNDFGLSVEEILMANTKELNKWASVKKAIQIRPKYSENNDVEVYKRRAQNEQLKRKILPSLFVPVEEESEDENIKKRKNKIKKFNDDGEEKAAEASKATEKLKKKKKKNKNKVQEEPLEEKEVADAEVAADSLEKKKKKKKKASMELLDISNNQIVEEIIPNSTGVEGEKKKKRKKKNKQENEVKEVIEEVKPAEMESKKKKDKKRKLKVEENDYVNHKKRKTDKSSNKNSFKKDRSGEGHKPKIPDSRLLAFGINPKRYKNKMKYSKPGAQQNHRSNKKNKNKEMKE